MTDIASITIKVDTSAIDGLSELIELLTSFIKDNKITCAEAIYQNDSVIRGAYDLIEGICDIVGYYGEGEEE